MRDTASDEKAAMDESNILDERTRGAAKPDGSYAEPGDEEVRDLSRSPFAHEEWFC